MSPQPKHKLRAAETTLALNREMEEGAFSSPFILPPLPRPIAAGLKTSSLVLFLLSSSHQLLHPTVHTQHCHPDIFNPFCPNLVLGSHTARQAFEFKKKCGKCVTTSCTLHDLSRSLCVCVCVCVCEHSCVNIPASRITPQ